MLSKFCSWRGCKATIPISRQYCEAHMPAAEEQEAQRQKRYDTSTRYTRDKQYYSFYKSTAWERTKQFIHNRYHGLCLYSLLVNKKIVQADAVHHIVPLREDWGKRLDTSNLIPLAGSIHGMIESEYIHGDKQGMQDTLRHLIKQWESEHGRKEG